MYLESIKLTNFKNYVDQSVRFSASLNCFVGKNGMGKTNLLDAIYYLCMCKSRSGMNDRNVVLHDAEFFRLEGIILDADKKEKIVAKIIPRKKKIFESNGVAYEKLLEHIGRFPVVMIVPDDTLLVTEGSEIRRRFIDNTLSQLDPVYLRYLLAYNKILKHRNGALKQFASQRFFDEKLIAAYNEQMLKPAEYIYRKRLDFSKLLSPLFEKYYAIISGAKETVSCKYASLLTKINFMELMQENIEKDRILQRTTCGVHRDDLKFFIDNYPLKQFASQGQLKSFVLAIKLAQYELLRSEKGKNPLLLLDDIFDKLDSSRVEQLIGLLLENQFGQIFITDTHENRMENIIEKFDSDFKKFIIEDGKVVGRK